MRPLSQRGGQDLWAIIRHVAAVEVAYRALGEMSGSLVLG